MCWLWFWITEHATVISTVVTSIATAFIAWFTVQLRRVTRDQLVHNQIVERAHIFAKGVSITPRIDVTNETIRSWRIITVLGNSGSTSTKNAFLHISSSFVPEEIPEDFDFPDYWTDNEPKINIPISIGPGAELLSAPQDFTLVDVEHVYKRRGHAYIWGWIDYNDVFIGTSRHRTEFCYQLIVTGDPSLNVPANLTLRPHRKYNGTDTECLKQPQPYI